MSNKTISRPRLTQGQRQKIKRLRKEGLTHKAIASVVGCGVATVYRVVHNTTRAQTKSTAKPIAKTIAKKATSKQSQPCARRIKTEFSLFWGLIKVVQTQ